MWGGADVVVGGGKEGDSGGAALQRAESANIVGHRLRHGLMAA